MEKSVKKLLLCALLSIVLFSFIRFSVYYFQNIGGVGCGGSKITGCGATGMQEWILLGAVVLCFSIYLVNKIRRL